MRKLSAMLIRRLPVMPLTLPLRQGVTPTSSIRVSDVKRQIVFSLAGLLVVSIISACGGGNPDGAPAEATEAQDVAKAMSLRSFVLDRRRAVATVATANSETNACSLVRPFYWEIGDKDGVLASGSTDSSTRFRYTYTRRTPMSYASASKWLYAAYVIQRRGGTLNETDVKMLQLESGYTNLKACEPTQTVDSCLAVDGNGDYNALADGKFFYNSGHMQKHASLIGLGAHDNAGLAAELRNYLGAELQLSYSQPQLAGGAYGSSETYARFLQKILSGELLMSRMLGKAAVCTNPITCGLSVALLTPIPTTESWTYSLGHWVEADPEKGDGAFSSGGGLGFYPWIDAEQRNYGIVARVGLDGGQPSADCGRLIRKAWFTGAAQ